MQELRTPRRPYSRMLPATTARKREVSPQSKEAKFHKSRHRQGSRATSTVPRNLPADQSGRHVAGASHQATNGRRDACTKKNSVHAMLKFLILRIEFLASKGTTLRCGTASLTLSRRRPGDSDQDRHDNTEQITQAELQPRPRRTPRPIDSARASLTPWNHG